MRLFCLPYSGGSAMFYARWRRLLPAWIDVRPVEWPGRGARMDEPLATDPEPSHRSSPRNFTRSSMLLTHCLGIASGR